MLSYEIRHLEQIIGLFTGHDHGSEISPIAPPPDANSLLVHKM